MYILKYFCLILYIFHGNGVTLAVSLFSFCFCFLVILASGIEAFVENLCECHVSVCMCMRAYVCVSGCSRMDKELLHLLLAAEEIFTEYLLWPTYSFKHFICIITFDFYNNPMRSVLLLFPFLQVRKLRQMEVKQLAQIHRTNKWQSWSSNLSLSDCKVHPVYSTIACSLEHPRYFTLQIWHNIFVCICLEIYPVRLNFYNWDTVYIKWPDF